MRSEGQEAETYMLGFLEVDETKIALLWIDGISESKVALVQIAGAESQLGVKVDLSLCTSSCDSLMIVIRNAPRHTAPA